MSGHLSSAQSNTMSWWTEADDGIAERMTVAEMFDSFERDLEDLEALKVCVG